MKIIDLTRRQSPPEEDDDALNWLPDRDQPERDLERLCDLADEVPRTVTATSPGGTRELTATVRIDTPAEAAYYQHGGSSPTCSATSPTAEFTGPAPGSGPDACLVPVPGAHRRHDRRPAS